MDEAEDKNSFSRSLENVVDQSGCLTLGDCTLNSPEAKLPSIWYVHAQIHACVSEILLTWSLHMTRSYE
ncbi:hypothetical protein AAHA92_14061 [Salvia divinorum]|uniref:Uncharacterized protein n=1 Tax=Salvia divinorum TaxID=28513 RepID=A0ABD1HAA4_SALDI